jgi:DeoD family purine-nucleoside phosphorylase
MATKHMNAAPGDFADTVMMPGDPLRAQYIADTYLEGARRVTDVRNMWGFTGDYKGRAVSVMAHGMGIPSASIYATELITEYDVKRVIRVGSCGTSHPDVQLRDIVIAMGASTDSNCNRMRFGGYDLAALASFERSPLSRRQYFLGRPFLYAGSRHVRDHGEVQCLRSRDGSGRDFSHRGGERCRSAGHLHGK